MKRKIAWNSNKSHLDDPRILSGENHPRWHKGKNQSKYLIEFKMKRKEIFKSNPKCLYCDNPAKILHHLDKNTFNNSDNNLIPLCSSCHTTLHNKERGITVYKHNCEWCGEEFTILNNKKCDAKYCSLSCKSKAHYKLGLTLPQNKKGITMYNKTCPCCNVQYTTNRPKQKYCSNKCRFTSQNLSHRLSN